MDSVGAQRKAWNKNLKELRKVLDTADTVDLIFELFSKQHGMVHSGALTGNKYFSFEDEVFAGLSEDKARRIPKNKKHSIVWCIWHIARIEDITMNILIAGRDQLFREADWPARLGIPYLHTGNDMGEHHIAEISAGIELESLRTYRLEVGKRTREIVASLALHDFKTKVDPLRLQRLIDEEAVLESARGLLDYWGKRTFAGLLLMPATRHNLVHLNEALVLKQRRA